MKKVTITLEFEGENAEYIDAKSGGVDVTILLRDALADFRHARMPIEEYVAKRYAESDDRFRRFKQGDVAKRVAFSAVLSKALVTINVESGPTSGTCVCPRDGYGWRGEADPNCPIHTTALADLP